MLTPDVHIIGFSASDWSRLLGLLRAPALPPGTQALDGPQGGLIAVTTGSRLRKLVSTRHGRLDVRAGPWPEPLDELAARHGARWILRISTGALEELVDRFAERLAPGQTYLLQALLLLSAARELEGEGALELWPWRLSQWPVPNASVVNRSLDALCPVGKTFLVGVFANGELWSAVAARRKSNGFDKVLGPAELRSEMGLLSGDWTRDYRHLVRATQQLVGPVGFGCFSEEHTLRRLLELRTPGAWAAAVAARDVILSPIVAAAAVPLSIDLGRAAVHAAKSVAERVGAGALFGPQSPFGPALDRVQHLQFFEQDLKNVLGFDPLDLLRNLMRPK